MKVDGMGVVQHLFFRTTDRIEESDPVYAPIINAPLQRVLDNTVALFAIINQLTGMHGARMLAETQLADLVSKTFSPGFIHIKEREEGTGLPSDGSFSRSNDGRGVVFGRAGVLIEGREITIPKGAYVPFGRPAARLENGTLFTSGQLVELGYWPPADEVWKPFELVDAADPSVRMTLYYNDDMEIAVRRLSEGQSETSMDNATGWLRLTGQLFEGVSGIIPDGLVFIEAWPQLVDPVTGIGLLDAPSSVEDSVVYPDGYRGQFLKPAALMNDDLHIRGEVVELDHWPPDTSEWRPVDIDGELMLFMNDGFDVAVFELEEHHDETRFDEATGVLFLKGELVEDSNAIEPDWEYIWMGSGNLFTYGEVVELDQWPPPEGWTKTPVEDMELYLNEHFDVAVFELHEDAPETSMDLDTGVLSLRGEAIEGVRRIVPRGYSVPLQRLLPYINDAHLGAADPGEIAWVQQQFRIRFAPNVSSLLDPAVKAQGPEEKPGNQGFEDLGNGLYAAGAIRALPVLLVQGGVVTDLRKTPKSIVSETTLQKSGGTMQGPLAVQGGVAFGEGLKIVYNEDKDSLDFVPV